MVRDYDWRLQLLQTTLILLSLVRRHVAPEDILEQGFECELNGEFIGDANGNPCGFPVTDFTGSEEFMNLDPGQYNFTVTAYIVISEGGPPIFDETPESIIWTILEEEPIVVETTLEAEDGNGERL